MSIIGQGARAKSPRKPAAHDEHKRILLLSADEAQEGVPGQCLAEMGRKKARVWTWQLCLIIPTLSNDITVTINKFCSAADVEFCGASLAPVGARIGARKKRKLSREEMS
jgi:hypothetical protein